MPLVNLTTNLKSLKYGKDRPGGGSSKQPFIQTSAKNSFDLPIDRLGNEIAGIPAGPDFVLRGGLLAPARAATDASRLFQLFTQTPSGLQFTAKQNLLSRTSVQTEASMGPGYGFNAVNQGIYTPLSTLSQTLTGFGGAHLNLLGIDPTGLTPLGLIKYETAVKSLNQEIGNFEVNGVGFYTNRLLRLGNSEINTKSNSVNITSYSGGPGSNLGVGRTNIRFADQRTGINNPLSVSKPGFFYGTSKHNITVDYLKLTSGKTVSSYAGLNPEENNLISSVNGGLLYNNFKVESQFYINKPLSKVPSPFVNPAFVEGVSEKAGITPEENNIQDDVIILPSVDTPRIERKPTKIQDFRKLKKGNKVKAPDYNYKNIEQRVNLGDPGNPNIDRSDYTAGGGSARTGVDRINSLYLYKSSIPKPTAIINDLVKFRIATIDPDNPGEVTYAHFRAFINGMSDSYGAEWNSFKYMGRGESFYNYQGFNRSMRLNWTVVAQSKEELSIMYQKLNYLASTLAPNYSAAGFMRGNIHRLTVGGYVYEYPGIIESLDFTVPDDSTWEIGIPVNSNTTSNTSGTVSSDSSVKELPHRIEVAMSFRPIDKFLPQTIKDINGGGDIKERFLSLQDAFNNNVNDLYNDGIPEWAKTGK